ncbi:MAG: hypothetical protein RLZZ292_1750, partial [Bacteroidota bacterium]
MEENNVKNTQNWMLLLLGAYTVVTGFTQIDILAIYTGKIQAPELLFLLVFPILLYLYWTKRKNDQLPWIWSDALVVTFLVLNLLVAFIPTNKHIYAELGRLFYIASIYLIFNLCLPRQKEELQDFIVNSFTVLGVVHGAIGVIGWASWYFFDVQLTNGWSPSEPYLYGMNGLGRAAGFCSVPGMLTSILSMSFLLKFSQIWGRSQSLKSFKNWEYIALFIMGLGIVLTITRTMVVFGMTMLCLLLWFGKERLTFWQRRGLKILIFSIFCLNFLLTHILIIKKEKANWTELSTAFTVDHPFASIGNYYLVETNYWVNKRCAVLTGYRFFPWGVGARQYDMYIEELRKEGIYPNSFPQYSPHCVFTGAFAELGILGLLWLLCFLGLFAYYLRHYLKYNSKDGFTLGLMAVGVYGITEMISADTFTYRTYWILFAVIASMYRNKIYNS